MKYLEILNEVLKDNFGKKPFLIKHALTHNPLFKLSELAKLAGSLPPENLRHNFNNQEVQGDYQWIGKLKLPKESTIQQVVENIKAGTSWMVLKYVEQDTSYRQKLDECLDQIQKMSDGFEPGMGQRQGFIFVTSPNQVTPFHLDPEHNFLLQINGSKMVHIFDPQNRAIVPSQELEKYFSGASKQNVGNLQYQPSFEKKGIAFELKPGDGLYFPPLAPHWIQNGPEHSISFSITFRTRLSKKIGSVYALNNILRRSGLSPLDPGSSRTRDFFKFQLSRILNHFRGFLNRN